MAVNMAASDTDVGLQRGEFMPKGCAVCGRVSLLDLKTIISARKGGNLD